MDFDNAATPWVRTLGKAALLFIAYFLSACFAITLSRNIGSVAAIWPATAVALGVLLLSPARDWPAYLLAAGAADLERFHGLQSDGNPAGRGPAAPAAGAGRLAGLGQIPDDVPGRRRNPRADGGHRAALRVEPCRPAGAVLVGLADPLDRRHRGNADRRAADARLEPAGSDSAGRSPTRPGNRGHRRRPRRGDRPDHRQLGRRPSRQSRRAHPRPAVPDLGDAPQIGRASC